MSVHDLVLTKSEISSYEYQVKLAMGSNIRPKHLLNGSDAMIVILMGRELGIPPMTAMRELFVVNGRPEMSARLKLARIRKRYPVAQIDFETKSNDINKAILVAARPNGRPQIFEYTIEDARRAGLTNKDVWKNHPADMLRARVINRMSYTLFPECIMRPGDELSDYNPDIQTDLDVYEAEYTESAEETQGEKRDLTNLYEAAEQHDVSANDIKYTMEVLFKKSKSPQLTAEEILKLVEMIKNDEIIKKPLTEEEERRAEQLKTINAMINADTENTESTIDQSRRDTVKKNTSGRTNDPSDDRGRSDSPQAGNA